MLQDVGRNIRRIRRERDLSQTQVARVARIRQQELSNIEKGLQPPLEVIGRIARVLCVSVDDLLASPDRTPTTESEAMSAMT